MADRKDKFEVKIDDTTAFGCSHHNHCRHRVYVDGLNYVQAKRLRAMFELALVDDEIQQISTEMADAIKEREKEQPKTEITLCADLSKCNVDGDGNFIIAEPIKGYSIVVDRFDYGKVYYHYEKAPQPESKRQTARETAINLQDTHNWIREFFETLKEIKSKQEPEFPCWADIKGDYFRVFAIKESEDGCFEGVVVRVDTNEPYNVGYFSDQWVAEEFNFSPL